MSRELRNILYVAAGLLMVSGIVLIALPITIAAGITDSVDCGSVLQPSGLELIYAQCNEEYQSRGILAAVVGVAGVLLAAAVAYMTYFAGKPQAAESDNSAH